MHSQLEQYLSEVAAELGPMPAKRRTEELREMRAHLENAVIVSRELGQSEEEAAQDIVAQFGTPQDLSENVVWAWRRGVMRDWRDLGQATAWAFLLTLLTHLLVMHFGAAHLGGLILRDALPSAGIGVLIAVCGQRFPRRAVLGVGAGIALFHVCFHALFHLHYAYAIGDAAGGLLGTWLMVRLTAGTTRKWPARRRLARH